MSTRELVQPRRRGNSWAAQKHGHRLTMLVYTGGASIAGSPTYCPGHIRRRLRSTRSMPLLAGHSKPSKHAWYRRRRQGRLAVLGQCSI